MNYELRIKVIPNSKHNQIVEKQGDWLKIKLSAPAIEGKANIALIKFLAEEFKIAKSKIKIIKGHKGRDKIISIGD